MTAQGRKRALLQAPISWARGFWWRARQYGYDERSSDRQIRSPRPTLVWSPGSTLTHPAPQQRRGVLLRHFDRAVGYHGAVDAGKQLDMRDVARGVQVRCQPRRSVGHPDKAVLDHRGLGVHAHDLVGLRPVARDGVKALLDQFLDQLGARGLVLYQHHARPEPLVFLAHAALQLGVFHAPVQYVEQIEVLALDPPARAHAEIAELGRLVGGVPALYDAVEALGQFRRRVMAEPNRLDETAAQWRGGLLVLAGEIVLPDRPADLLEHCRRLALGVQCLAPPTGKMPRSPYRLDRVGFVLLGDRREAHDLPIFLGQHVADEIVLVQPVHDQDDGTLLLVVQSAVEGMVEPLVGSPPLGLRQGLLGLQRIVDDNDVCTPSGQHPADRGGEPAPLGGRLELRYGLALRGKPGREGPLVPFARDDTPAIARELVGEILRVADAEDLRAGPTPEAPRRKRDRAQQRLQVARRHIDDQPPDLTLVDRGQLCGHDLDVPVHRERHERVELAKTALCEGGEIEPQLGVLLALGQRLAVHRRGYGHRSRWEGGGHAGPSPPGGGGGEGPAAQRREGEVGGAANRLVGPPHPAPSPLPAGGYRYKIGRASGRERG